MADTAPNADPVHHAAIHPDLAGERIVAKVMRRVIPFIILLHILNYVDRMNVSFAKLQMSGDLSLSSTAYGLGAGIFFIGYFIFEIPSNLILERVGARLWIARIMISWGLISSSMMFIRGPVSFYVLRFLLGAAEAGFAPGVLLYLTYWIPARQRARAVAWWLTATALSGVVGMPLAGLIVQLNGHSIFGHPLHGWQWLFLLEGIPSVICGALVLLLLTDTPQKASWLTPREKDWLGRVLDEENQQRSTHGHTSLSAALRDARVWLLGAVYFLIMSGFQGVNLWLPSILKDGFSLRNDMYVGLLSAIPFAAAVVVMVLVGLHSDRTGERRWHTALAATTGSLGFLLAALTAHSPILALASLSLAAAGIWATLGPFWAMPPVFLTGTAAAAGLALINSIGNLGGFASPYMMGALEERTKGYSAGLLCLAGSLLLAAMLTLLLRRLIREPAQSSHEPR